VVSKGKVFIKDDSEIANWRSLEFRRSEEMTFGRRVLCKRNPWRRPVIKFQCYYRNALFSSIQFLFYAASLSPR